MLRTRRSHRFRRRPRITAVPPTPPPSFSSVWLALMEARDKTSEFLARLKKEEPETRTFLCELALEAARGLLPHNCVEKRRQLEKREQECRDRLEALEFFAERFATLVEEYKRERPDEVRTTLTAKLQDYEARQTQPGAPVAELVGQMARIENELESLKPSAQSRSKKQKKGSPPKAT